VLALAFPVIVTKAPQNLDAEAAEAAPASTRELAEDGDIERVVRRRAAIAARLDEHVARAVEAGRARPPVTAAAAGPAVVSPRWSDASEA